MFATARGVRLGGTKIAAKNNTFTTSKSSISSVSYGMKPERFELETKENKLGTKYYGKRRLRFPLTFNFLQNKSLWYKEDVTVEKYRDPRMPEIPPTAEERRNLQLDRKINSMSRIYDEESTDKNKVYFRNVPFFLTEKELKKTFETAGIVKSVVYHRDKNGQFLGYGVAEFKNEEAAQAAITNLNGHHLIQRKIIVQKFERNPFQLHYSNMLLVTNLPKNTELITQIFSLFGKIKEIREVKPLGRADKKVVRHTIEFSLVEDAIAAREKTHNQKVGDNRVCVQFCSAFEVIQPHKLTEIDLSLAIPKAIN